MTVCSYSVFNICGIPVVILQVYEVDFYLSKRNSVCSTCKSPRCESAVTVSLTASDFICLSCDSHEKLQSAALIAVKHMWPQVCGHSDVAPTDPGSAVPTCVITAPVKTRM